jgi:hypothetical protein
MTSFNLPPFEGILLAEKPKEELIEEILRLRKRNEELEKELEELKKQGSRPPLKFSVPTRRRRWKKLGRPAGHPGITRHKPEVIHQTVHQTLECCPDCGQASLRELPSELEEHVQEDIVPARVEATRFLRYGYWCTNCKKKKQAPYAPEEVPYGYLGPNALIHTLLLKYHYGLPYSKIQLLFRELCGLTVTDSALAQALQRLAKWLKVEEGEIMKAIRASPWIHIDETGWKIAGRNHWLWDFVNESLALYRIRQSRGRKIPEEVLTGEYRGITISDFLSAYDKSGRERQRCLVHLVRELDECRERDTSEEYLLAYRKLKRILQDARRLNEARGRLAPWTFARRVRLLKDRLFHFITLPFTNRNWARLSNRLLKCYGEIFTFLAVPGLPQDNNHAERMIRPNVIFRKISFQNMSPKGAEAHEVLMSLLQTLRLQEKNAIDFFKTAYLRHRQGNDFPLLFLPTR